MPQIQLRYIFDVIPGIRFSTNGLNHINLTGNGLEIDISPPYNIKQKLDKVEIEIQKIEIVLKPNVPQLPNNPEDVKGSPYNSFNQKAEDLFWKVLSLVRYRTRQFCLCNQQIDGIEKTKLQVYNQQGQNLFGHNTSLQNFTIYMRPEDPYEYSLDQNIWQQIGNDLQNDTEPEKYYMLLLDAKYFILAWRLWESILLAALAVEYFTTEYLKRDKMAEGQSGSFYDFFAKAVCEERGKSIKHTYMDKYHKLSFLFQTRNNIAHGEGCFFSIGNTQNSLILGLFPGITIPPDRKIDVDKKIGMEFINNVIDIFDWVKT